MRVNGNIKTVLSGYNFYLKYLNPSARISEQELKKSFFDKFLKEDLQEVEKQIKELKELEKQKRIKPPSCKKSENESLPLEEENVSSGLLNFELDVEKGEIEKGSDSRPKVIANVENENISSEIENDVSSSSELNSEVESVELEKASSNTYQGNFYNEIEDLGSTGVEENTNNFHYSAKGFLDAIRGLSEANEQSPSNYHKDIGSEGTADRVDGFNYVTHGIFIDVYSKEVDNYADTVYSKVEYTPHGVFIDEYQKKKDFKQNNTGYDSNTFKEHGIFIDEYTTGKTYSKNKEVNVETSYKENNKYPEVESSFTESSEQEDESIYEEKLKSTFSDTLVKQSSVGQYKESIKEDTQEVIVVPTNIRDFIKSNQGAEMSYVLKYYSKKDISKAINLGKIYTKGGKLYI